MIKKYDSLSTGIKASVWFLVCGFVQKAISLITTPIFTRILSVEEYGKISVFSSWMSICSIFVSLNLCGGIYTRGLVIEKNKEEFVSSMQMLSLSVVLVWTTLYLIFRDFFNHIMGLETYEVLSMLVLIWLSSVVGFWSASQRIELNYKPVVLCTMLASFFRPVIGVLFVLSFDNKVQARIVGMVLVDFIVYSWMFAWQVKKGKKIFNGELWIRVLKFNIPLIPHYLSMSILNSSDRIMISKMTGDSEAGIYNLAYSVSQIMIIFNTALMQTIDPWLYKTIKEKRTCEIGKIAYITFTVISFVNILLIFFAPEIISIFAPVEYNAALYIIPPIAMSGLFIFAYNFFAVFEFYYEKKAYLAVASSFGAIFNVLLNYVFIRIFGYYAAGYTTLICYILFAIVHYIFMKKICFENCIDEIYQCQFILLIAIIFLCFGFGIMFTYSNSYLRYSLIILVCCLIFIFRKKLYVYLLKISEVRKQ